MGIGMNLLRQAYLAAAPELRRYIVTGSSDDEAGIMATFGARPGRELSTSSYDRRLAVVPVVPAPAGVLRWPLDA